MDLTGLLVNLSGLYSWIVTKYFPDLLLSNRSKIIKEQFRNTRICDWHGGDNDEVSIYSFGWLPVDFGAGRMRP